MCTTVIYKQQYILWSFYLDIQLLLGSDVVSRLAKGMLKGAKIRAKGKILITVVLQL